MKPPTPEELGLPEKVEDWRPGQWQCIENGVTCEERFDGHCVPTGGGKTWSYLSMLALMMKPGQRAAIVTATKGLQDQIMREASGAFPIINIMGKSNYGCGSRPNWTCEDGHAGRCPSAGTDRCSWSRQYFKAIVSPIVLTNYSFWMAIHKYGHGLGNFDYLILDEAHQAFHELSGAVQVQLSSNEVEDILHQKFPKDKDSMESWKSWANPLRQMAQDAAKEQFGRIRDHQDPPISWIREYRHLRNMVRKFATIARIKPADWIHDDWEHGFQFDAIRPSRYAETYLYLRIPRVMLFSATINPKVLSMVGIRENFKYWEYPAVFSPEGNPLIHVPTCHVNKNMSPTDVAVWLMRSDQIIGQRLDRRGIFHTVSYERRDLVFNKSEYARYVHTNRKGDITASVAERFMRAAPPAILVSPSYTTGWDFMHDAARYQIIGKVPWPNINSKLYKARESFDPLYGPTVTMQTLMQTVGRARRAEDDWAENLCIDDGIWRFLQRYRSLGAKWFYDSYRNESCIPPPPALREAA